ncbi:MAG: acyl-CoA dehydrogenase family protein [bacterium]
MERFEGVDYMDFDSLLAEEEVLIRDTVRGFVEDEVVPVIEEEFSEERSPHLWAEKLASLGLFGSYLPEEYGGAGANNVAYGLICQELERGDSGLRSFVSVQSSLVMWPIFAYGSQEQKETYLPPMARGEVIGCFGLTEPDYGSNPAGMITRAAEGEDHYLLDGAKMWITNGSIADVSLVWAKLDGEVRGFLVHKEDEGFSARRQRGKHSLKASDTSELVLEGCRIPKDRILPAVKGLRGPLSCLTQARYGIAWGTIGSAMAVYDVALRYSRERIQFDRPIARFQLVQQRLVRMITEITKSQFMNLQVGRLKDRDEASPAQVSMAKMNGCRVARESARLARETLGANGITGEYPVMRHLMNIESVYTYEGTDDMHTLIVGQEITGSQAFT